MKLTIGLVEAFDMIRHNRMRTFLTMFGMNVGVAAIIAVVSLGAMARTEIMREVDSIGASLMWTYPQWDLYEDDWSLFKPLRYSDAGNLEYILGDVLVCPYLSGNEDFAYGGFHDTVNIMGTDESYFDIWDHPLSRGRYFSARDAADIHNVAILGARTARGFFGSGNPLGETVLISGRPFTVIGVLEARGQSMMGDGTDDSTVYVPVERYLPFRDGGSGSAGAIDTLFLKLTDLSRMEEVRSVLKGYLIAEYGLFDGQERFRVEAAEDQIKTFNKIFSIITLVISLLAGISLLVGGIGIMNIMLVSISERTREIGIRKSLGARRRDILGQFLVEAIVICLLGGGIGLLIGAGFSALVGATQSWPFLLSPGAVILALGLSTAVGLFFGIYPAVKASRMDPVDALSKAA